MSAANRTFLNYDNADFSIFRRQLQLMLAIRRRELRKLPVLPSEGGWSDYPWISEIRGYSRRILMLFK